MTARPKAPLLVHIGYHKTATTFLQGRLFSDTALFSQPWGVQAAPAVEWFILTHPERFSPEAARAEFDAACGPETDPVPVISHEALSGQPGGGRYYADRVVRRLHATFPEARIVIGTRSQKKLLVSLYYQYVKMGGTMPVTQFVTGPSTRIGFRPRVRLEHFEYDLMLDLYRRHYGADDILLLPMELLARDPGAYTRRLLDFAGLPEASLAPAPAENVRRAPVTMQLERFFNRFIPHPDPRPERYRDYSLAYRAKNRALRVFETLPGVARMGKAEQDRISAHIDTVVGDYYAESNARLAGMVDLDMADLGYV